MLARTTTTFLALCLISHGAIGAFDSSSVPKSGGLIGEWVGEDTSISLFADGTGSLKYTPPRPPSLSERVFPIKRWSLSGKKVRLKLEQDPDARNDDGHANTLDIKARFEPPSLILELWDTNHFRRITMQRESEQSRLVQKLALNAEADTTKIDREILRAGTNGVTNPRLIMKTRISPKLPRKLKGSGQVILQGIVEANGTVSYIFVVHCNRPGLGIEKSAMRAVRNWRYEPAEKDGKPVAVYFTIIVNLTYLG